MSGMKAHLHRYLQHGRDAVLWKLEGASEYDVRRPLTPTGTNLLGLVKHLANVEAGYFGACFGRPLDDGALVDLGPDGEPNADMWATPEESRADVVGLYGRVRAHADATIDALDLDTPGHVPWWGENGATTLGQVLVHMTVETHRHAGHADVVRELADGSAGLRADVSNLPEDVDWPAYRQRLEDAARQASR